MVNSAPYIITAPVNQTVCSGSSASFSVNATGTGLTYHWRKGTVNLVNGGNISGATSITLTINPVNSSNTANNYSVVITGACSPISPSANVSLMVNTAPDITTESANQTACVGSSVSFPIAATGTDLTYQWRKGTLSLSNGGSISGATAATLTISPVSFSDSATNFNVVISGTCAPATTSAFAALSVCAATGINSFVEGNTNAAVSITPNPFKTSLNIFINESSQIGNTELRIYNILGDEVISTTLTRQFTTLETNNLASGIYFFKMVNDGKTIQTGKLVSER